MTERKEYEFTENENKNFSKLAFNLRLVAVALVIIGITSTILGLIPEFNILLLISGLTYLLMGIVFYLPIDNFLKITTNEGSDIKELIQGLTELNKGWVLVIGILVLNRIVQFTYVTI
jgi:hypothetical protein